MRASPEHRLQAAVCEYLGYCLPSGVEWTASLAGAHLSASQRSKAKAAGLRRGFPDLMFILPDRTVRFIEMKAGSALSKEQERIRDALHADHWAVCRSVDGVADTLTSWGLRLKAMPFASARNSLLNTPSLQSPMVP